MKKIHEEEKRKLKEFRTGVSLSKRNSSAVIVFVDRLRRRLTSSWPTTQPPSWSSRRWRRTYVPLCKSLRSLHSLQRLTAIVIASSSSHDVIDIAGLTAFSFGIEDVDRHVVVYKKDSVPNEDELLALRRGEVYDPEKVRLQKQMVSGWRVLHELMSVPLQKEQEEREQQSRPQKIVPKSDFKEKYEHLIGREAGVSAAQITTTNKQFGLGWLLH